MDREQAKMIHLVTNKMNKEEVFSDDWLKERRRSMLSNKD